MMNTPDVNCDRCGLLRLLEMLALFAVFSAVIYLTLQPLIG